MSAHKDKKQSPSPGINETTNSTAGKISEKKSKDERSWRLVQKVQYLLLGLMVCGFSLLLGMQLLLTQDSWRQKLPQTLRYEGAAYEATLPVEEEQNELFGHIVLSLADYTALPQAAVVINGSVAARFNTEEVTVRVTAGDHVIIDSSAYNQPIRVRLLRSSVNIATSLPGTVTTQNGSCDLGCISFK